MLEWQRGVESWPCRRGLGTKTQSFKTQGRPPPPPSRPLPPPFPQSCGDLFPDGPCSPWWALRLPCSQPWHDGSGQQLARKQRLLAKVEAFASTGFSKDSSSGFCPDLTGARLTRGRKATATRGVSNCLQRFGACSWSPLMPPDHSSYHVFLSLFQRRFCQTVSARLQQELCRMFLLFSDMSVVAKCPACASLVRIVHKHKMFCARVRTLVEATLDDLKQSAIPSQLPKEHAEAWGSSRFKSPCWHCATHVMVRT